MEGVEGLFALFLPTPGLGLPSLEASTMQRRVSAPRNRKETTQGPPRDSPSPMTFFWGSSPL